MKEIGGYFQLEQFINNEYHKKMLSFSSARNCLVYLIKKRNIKKLFLPYYLCDVVKKNCFKEKVDVQFYSIDRNFLPIIDSSKINKDSYLYIVNYYGLFSTNDILSLKQKYQYIILDNTHSFFQKSVDGVDTIYNCRKYFGVPDGAYLSTNLQRDNEIERGISSFRFAHLIGRYEKSASEFYQEFKIADETFDNEKLFYMSRLTENLMGAIDYEKVKRKREGNFLYLHKFLKKYNQLNLEDKSLDFMYPFLIDDASELRNILISNKIYIPILWPNVIEECPSDSIEYRYANYILPLPIDQRYDNGDMDIIINMIENFFKKKEGKK